MYMLGVPGHPATPESQTLPYASCFGIVLAAAADSAFWQRPEQGGRLAHIYRPGPRVSGSARANRNIRNREQESTQLCTVTGLPLRGVNESCQTHLDESARSRRSTS